MSVTKIKQDWIYARKNIAFSKKIHEFINIGICFMKVILKDWKYKLQTLWDFL